MERIKSGVSQSSIARESGLLNMALFGKTAQQWRDENPEHKGNIRDDANAAQRVCLANLETLYAHLFINTAFLIYALTIKTFF
ncbi:MAG: hypothetical protein PF495_12095 [Spirochaetales bacterium]|jgi:hypothetical protein|nr:hypothetical protein [Spirochaetales bacterium]